MKYEITNTCNWAALTGLSSPIPIPLAVNHNKLIIIKSCRSQPNPTIILNWDNTIT